MMRKVYLEGEMGERFGTGFHVNAPTVRDVLKCMDCNYPDLKRYLIECHDKGIGFEVDVASNKLDYIEEMLMTLKEGDVTITPIPAGSKSGGAKLLGAIALAALFLTPLGPSMLLATTPATAAIGTVGTSGYVAAVAASTALTWQGSIIALMAANLAMAGLSQVMAPDPASDADQEQNYLFNGNQQNIVEGDPVPVLYGKLRVPGQPINFEVAGIKSNVWRAVMIGLNGSTNSGGVS